MNHQVVQQHGSVHSIHDPRYVDPLPDWLFDPEALARRGLIDGTSVGRNQAWFFRLAEQPLVLRHYWRGGIVARFSPDVYVWTGRERTRAFREWRLLAHLRTRSLPVPAPVAARVRRRGACYRADLVTATIPEARPFDECLRAGRADSDTWYRVGEVVAACHGAGAWHADLNVRNILLDTAGTPWIIDWDRGRLRRLSPRWRTANLERLRRSLAKDPSLDALAQTHWSQLLAGYQAGSTPSRIR